MEGGGEEGGRLGRERREGGEGPEYLNNKHVLRNNVSRCLRRTTMVSNYVRRELDSHPDAQLNSQELVFKQVMSIPVK